MLTPALVDRGLAVQGLVKTAGKRIMNFNTDAILIFLAGMIFGGFIYVRVEALLMDRLYPGIRDEERLAALRKTGFMLTFAGVFCFVLVYFLLHSMLLAGICAGFAVFGMKP